MLYEQPKNLLQMRLNETLGKKEESMISELVKLSLLQKAEKDEDLLVFTEIYNLLGLEKFTALIDIIDGRKVDFPTKKDFKDTIFTVLSYYYRIIEGKDWSYIKNHLDMPDMNGIKFGIRSRQLEAFINKFIDKKVGSEDE